MPSPVVMTILGGRLGRVDCCVDNVALNLNALNAIQFCVALNLKPNFVLMLISLFISISFTADVDRIKVS
jgi:hypothetical protein